MNVRRNLLTAALVLLTTAIIFSPLIAALSTASFLPREIFQRLRNSVGASVTFALVAAIASVTLGLPFALLVDRSRPIVRRVCWLLAILTLIVPPYIVAESTIILFGPAGKISRNIALMLRLGPAASDSLGRARFAVPGFVFSTWVAGIMIGGCFFPIVALSVASVNRRIDRRIFESARLMRGRKGVVPIASRILFPATLGAALLVFALALNESVVPQLLRVFTIGESIYESIQEGNLSRAAGMSLAMLPPIVGAGALGAFMLIRARTASTAGLEGETPKFAGWPTRRTADKLAMMMAAIATIPGLAVPATGLAWLTLAARLPATTAGTHRVLRASGFMDSLRGAWEIARADALRTIVLAAMTATLALVLAVAVVQSISRSRWKIVLGGFVSGLAVPPPIVGLGLIVLWDRGVGVSVYQSRAIVVLAWLARFLPVAILLAQAALARVPRDLNEAAALMGRGPIQRLFIITFRTAAPGLIAAWLAVYVLSATEFVATLLVSPPGASMLAPSVVNLMRRGQDPEIAACQTLLLSVVAAPLIILCGVYVTGKLLRSQNP